ncbi:MAG: biotin--[acetyl-CoA-carboxylase] ligase [Burkholderiaceae bacterium]|nr:biotin--[acetyl-CoA-carboxylase] ligase [Burkholderiaceae bacterium]
MNALDAERIHAAAGCDALQVRSVDEIASTNEALMQRPFGQSPAPPALVATLHQTAGRGRRGRVWICEAGRALALSIAFERLVAAEAPPTALSIAVGVGAARALVPWAPDVRVKWPNDLQRAGRKLGGILVETRRGLPLPSAGSATCSIERIVVGIGLNLLAPRDARIAQPACGLFDDSPTRDDPESVIGCVAGEVVRAVERFLGEGPREAVAAWQRFDALDGEPVLVLEGDRVVASGRALGIDPLGGLRLLGEHGVRILRHGEVTLRRGPESAALAPAGPESGHRETGDSATGRSETGRR